MDSNNKMQEKALPNLDIAKQIQQVMMLIHNPQSFNDDSDEDTDEEKRELKKVEDEEGHFSIEVDPKGSWLTCDDELKYKKYKKDNEYFVEMDDETILTNTDTVVIIGVPRDRYENLGTTYIEVTGEKMTERKLVGAVRDYYHQVMTKEELKAVAGTDDGWGYNKKAENALNENTELKRYEIMGDYIWFEGLRVLDIIDGIACYQLLLGS